METEPADRFMDRGETPFGDFQKELEDIVRALRAWFYLVFTEYILILTTS